MKKRFGLLLLLTVISISPLFAAYNSLGIPDSSEIRSELVEEWFEAPLSVVRNYKSRVYYNFNGDIFQVRLEESDSFYSIIVSPKTNIQVEVYSDTGKTVEEQVAYPYDAAGSFVLIKDKKTDEPLRIRYYFLKNSEVFIQFTPNGKMGLTDLVIFGGYAAKGISTGVPFEKFYSTSFEEVMNYTKSKIPWNYVTIAIERYDSVRQMAAIIRNALPNIVYCDNAMYDEDGNLVNILTGKPLSIEDYDDSKIYLSSAGFLKWVADGLVEPITGGQLRREALLTETVKVKEVGYQGVLSQTYNLFFGLNWVRNLASAVVSVYTGSKYLYFESGVDVTVQPFATEMAHNKTANSVTFVSDSGYSVAGLKTLFYVLAATDPETFYFGSIRQTDRTVTPEVKAFNECVIFMPYFETNGAFSCFVFMNGREMTLEQFCQRYGEEFVYLTKVKSSERFYPLTK